MYHELLNLAFHFNDCDLLKKTNVLTANKSEIKGVNPLSSAIFCYFPAPSLSLNILAFSWTASAITNFIINFFFGSNLCYIDCLHNECMAYIMWLMELFLSLMHFLVCSASKVHPLRLDYFCSFGQVIALANGKEENEWWIRPVSWWIRPESDESVRWGDDWCTRERECRRRDESRGGRCDGSFWFMRERECV